MLALLTCILANILIAVCFKLFFRTGVHSFVAIVVNYWVCLILGSVFVGHVPILRYGLDTGWVPFGILLGLIFITGFNIIALSVKYTGITVTSVMQKMSLLLSSGYAIVFFKESAGIFKLVGILLAIAAVLMINAAPAEKGKPVGPGRYFIYPVLTLVLSGAIEIILYYVQATGISLKMDAELTTFAFSVAAVIGFFVVAVLYLRRRVEFQWKDYVGGIALGVPNFFSIYLILVLLQRGFEGSVVFPVLNISVLVLASLVGLLVFSERLTKVNLAGIIVAILSIVTIMVV